MVVSSHYTVEYDNYGDDEMTSKERRNEQGGTMGFASIFPRVGFFEAGRASETQLIMRYNVD